jgi:hypothetical protein
MPTLTRTATNPNHRAVRGNNSQHQIRFTNLVNTTMLILKIQYDSYEAGEFASEQNVNIDTLLDIFEENTQIIQTRRSYTIKRPYIKFFLQHGDNFLKISHFAKDAFSVEYCNEPDDKLYQGNFYKKTIKQILVYFSENNFEALNKKIPRTNKNEMQLIKAFYKLDFTYSYRYRGYFDMLFNSILFLPLAICGILLLYITPLGGLTLIPLIFLLSPLLIICFLIRLNLNYIKNSKGKIITLSSGSTMIKYVYDNHTIEFNKSDIKELIIYHASAHRNPFSSYSFARLYLKNGTTIDISHMILDSYLVSYKLNRIPSKRIYKIYPYIK